MKSPVLAFLQNMWFPEGTPQIIIDRYLTDQKYRRCVLGKCATGRRLATAFGEKYHEVWWENASSNRALVPNGKFPADLKHMESVIIDVAPKAILTFGKVASDMWPWINKEIIDLENERIYVPQIHAFPHPNARGLKQYQLNEFAHRVIKQYF